MDEQGIQRGGKIETTRYKGRVSLHCQGVITAVMAVVVIVIVRCRQVLDLYLVCIIDKHADNLENIFAQCHYREPNCLNSAKKKSNVVDKVDIMADIPSGIGENIKVETRKFEIDINNKQKKARVMS